MSKPDFTLPVDRLLAWSIRNPLPPLARYVAATLMVLLAGAVRVLFITSLLPWLLFLPMVLLIGLIMGFPTGIYAVLLSAALAGITIASPGAPVWLSGAQWVATMLFIAVGAVIVLIASELRGAFSRAQQVVIERERMNARLMEQEQRSRLLNQELGHRLKNLLTIVQAVAAQTLRQSPDLKSAAESLAFRLAAFGRAADVLTASTWEAADLHSLAATALAPHEGMAARFHVAGPPLRFNPQVSLALALAFHELATNAVKYGALSNEGGRVDLAWSIVPGANPEDARFHLTWRESGGPPVEEPSRRGFGSMMIERSLRSYLRGDVSIAYDPAGLVFAIDAPLAGAQVGMV